MRVVCTSLADFQKNLQFALQNHETVLLKTVYMDKSQRALGGEARTAVKFEVVFQVGTIIQLPENRGEYLLQCGEVCGVDYHDASQDYLGTETAEALREDLKTFCESHGLVVRPGIVDY